MIYYNIYTIFNLTILKKVRITRTNTVTIGRGCYLRVELELKYVKYINFFNIFLLCIIQVLYIIYNILKYLLIFLSISINIKCFTRVIKLEMSRNRQEIYKYISYLCKYL